MSSFLECPTGVPQGSVFGPIFFLCTSMTCQMSVKMFIFKCRQTNVIFTPAKTSEKASSILTAALVDTQQWLTSSSLLLNKKKTVSIMGRNLCHQKLNLNCSD
ncbi:hypothetical protein CHARACLAT_023860 [Characodon lateralis]|uniref:Reverse transcriptase domain-containing protein n=1 Tax=Characodon lateralis TaxID=208331 RepID=A0ABU7EDT9_9TELE|nr:hypothetical protein [Characodon lateralis]